ncbi:MAG: enoyl-CoA hydratase/isomerase family protein [Bacteroidetes bacterium]|nr:MAG: enoyl-CoA hydratase/isomerase family protein [Bacteroidota bacterium]
MKFIKYESRKRIGYITLSRPEKKNALNAEVVAELIQAFEQAENDGSSKVIVLKAEGDVFCAGADLAYIQKLQGNTFEENHEDSILLKDLFLQIYQLNKVVIAQIQGHAIAGGAGLAALCDFSFSVPDAKFGYTEVRIGFIPAIVLVFLLRKVGESKAKELLLSGNLIDSETAMNMGLINWVVDNKELELKVIDFAQTLVQKNSGQSMEVTKKMISKVQSMELDKALEYASEMNAKARQSEDCRKGIEAFLLKKPMEW